ncbi:MAG: ATP-binding cassette domain-containing protein [Thermomicrobiales bacterium]
MDAISVRNLTKTYRNGVEALRGVSFNVAQGEIFGLLGPNGAGKSTTVRILATLTQPGDGTATVNGHDVVSDPAGIRRSIGYVAQASGVDRWGTGRENLVLQAQILRVPPSEIKRRVDELLEWVELTEAADKLVNTYSGGMRRRIDIAMGLVHDPSILFLDEPTTGLDPETRAALWTDLDSLRRDRQLTVLLTTHYLEEADHLCDRLAIVDQGKVVVEGTPNDLKAAIRGDTVTLEVEGDTAEAARSLRDLEDVYEVIPNGVSVIANVARGAAAIPQLVTALERSGIGVHEVTLSRPSLDDVYLQYTGHRYSAGAADQRKEA